MARRKSLNKRNKYKKSRKSMKSMKSRKFRRITRSKRGGDYLNSAAGVLGRSAARTASSGATAASKLAVNLGLNQFQKTGSISKDQAKLGKQMFNTAANAANSGFKQIMTKQGIQNITDSFSNPEKALQQLSARATTSASNLYNKYQNPEEVAKLRQQASSALTSATNYVKSNPQIANLQSQALSSFTNGYNNIKQSASSSPQYRPFMSKFNNMRQPASSP